MKMNKEEEQLFLAAAYALQENKSNAASTPKGHMKRLVKREIGRRYCLETHKYIYFLQPIEETDIAVKPRRIVSTGRKPISEEKVKEIRQKRLEGHSVRSIAKMLGVGRGTVERYIKDLGKNGAEQKRI